MRSSPTVELPAIDALVLVDLGHQDCEIATGATSRVEGYDSGDMIIQAPRFKGDLIAAAVGLEVLVRWLGPRGVHTLATEIVDVRRARLTTWRVRPLGDVLIVQRRDYARAQLHTPIALVPVVAQTASGTRGSLIDLSEGGLRARIDGSPLLVGTQVEARLDLEGMRVGLLGNVLRLWQPNGMSSSHEVALIIVAGRNGDLIRRVVFHQQMLARRRDDS
jgi:hypothetical protein